MWKKVYLLISICLTFIMGVSLTDAERTSVTKERMVAISCAIEAYLEETGALPHAADVWELGGLLGKKLKTLPLSDAWGRPFHYSVRNPGADNGEYWLGSGAGQKNFEGLLKYILKTDSNPDDMILHNGRFNETSEEIAS